MIITIGLLLFGLIVFSIMYLGSQISRWRTFNLISSDVSKTAKLGLEQLRKLISINPDKWHYAKTYCYGAYHLYYNTYHTQVRLSFLAFLWYDQWYQVRLDKEKERKKENEALILILEDCQRDIDHLKAKADEQIKEALEQQKKVMNNWR